MPNEIGNREHDSGDSSKVPDNGRQAEGHQRETGSAVILTGTSTQISWGNEIRGRVAEEFERVRVSIETGSNKFRALDRAETATLLEVLEAHRAAVFSEASADYFVAEWQNAPDRLHRMINNDERWKSINDARQARKIKTEVAAPLRYLGFEDAAGVRIFRFGRFPSDNRAETFAVNFPVAMFLKHKISFQDGPAMCSAIMAAGAEPKDHWVTDEDSQEFISRRPVKGERKPPRQKAAVPAQ